MTPSSLPLLTSCSFFVQIKQKMLYSDFSSFAVDLLSTSLTDNCIPLTIQNYCSASLSLPNLVIIDA